MILEKLNFSEVIKHVEDICPERKFPVYSCLPGPVWVFWEYVFSYLTFKTFWMILSHSHPEPRQHQVQMLLFPVKVQKSISSSDHKTGDSTLLEHSTGSFNMTQKLLWLLDFTAC